MTFSFTAEKLTAYDSGNTPVGYIDFPRIRCGMVNICQVAVFPAFRKQGVEDQMMAALLDHLDTRGLKAALTCAFAQQYVKRHPQWQRILPGELHFTTH